MGVSINGESQNVWFTMEKWLKNADLEIHPMLGNLHILNRSGSSTLPGAAVRLRSYLWRFPINQGEPGTTPWHLEQNGEKTMTHPLRNYTLKASLIKKPGDFCYLIRAFILAAGPGSVRKSIVDDVVWLPATHVHPIPHVSGKIAHIGLCRGQDRLVGAPNGSHQKSVYCACSMSSAMIDLTMHPSDASKVRRSRLTLSILDQSSTVSLLGGLLLLGAVSTISICSFHQLHAFRISIISPNMIFGYIPTIWCSPP